MKAKWWINKNALLLNLSAFFADMGYQAILAGYPVFMVLVLGAPAYVLGITYAITYGGGAVSGYIGGRLGDILGRKRVAITGNIFILLLSLLGFAATALQSIILFAGGWWARDFRTPPRRAMLTEVTTKRNRGRAFGLLHIFDIGGGAIAVSYLLILLYLKFSLQTVFLLTAAPLIVSTVCLLFVRAGKNREYKNTMPEKTETGDAKINRNTLRGVLIATALFGFSFYSLGFPILTIAQESGSSMLGIISYGIYLIFSAATGYIVGTNIKRVKMIHGLSIFGYMLAAFASLLIGLSYAFQLGIFASYVAIAVLGIALGSVETLEPTIISFLSSKSEVGKKMGYLTASRSTGLFIANVGMGILYVVNPVYSYAYAFVISLSAAVILLYFGRNFKN